MKNPGIKTRVIHSKTNSAWNVVGVKLGGKHKIARVPYIVTCDQDVNDTNREEALEHAEFISHCFNQSDAIFWAKFILTPPATEKSPH